MYHVLQNSQSGGRVGQTLEKELRIQTCHGRRDQLGLDPAQACALDLASLVGPVQPVPVPVQVKRQDAVVGGEELRDRRLRRVPELHHHDLAHGGVQEPRVCGAMSQRKQPQGVTGGEHTLLQEEEFEDLALKKMYACIYVYIVLVNLLSQAPSNSSTLEGGQVHLKPSGFALVS